MTASQLVKETGKFVKKNIFGLLIISIIIIGFGVVFGYESRYLALKGEGQDIVTGGYSVSTNIWTTIVSFITFYASMEAYVAIKEARKFRTFGLFDMISKGGFKMLGLIILITIKTFLWSLLFVVPGIVKSYEYQRAVYLMVRDRDMSIGDAFHYAKEDMYGHKMTLFTGNLIIALPASLGILVAVITSIAVFGISADISTGTIQASGSTALNPMVMIIAGIILLFLLFGVLYTTVMNLGMQPVFNDMLDTKLRNRITNEIDN